MRTILAHLMPLLAFMKILVVTLLLALAAISSANAVLRPRRPHRTAPPSNRAGLDMAGFARQSILPN
jgi:hypothetical protein